MSTPDPVGDREPMGKALHHQESNSQTHLRAKAVAEDRVPEGGFPDLQLQVGSVTEVGYRKMAVYRNKSVAAWVHGEVICRIPNSKKARSEANSMVAAGARRESSVVEQPTRPCWVPIHRLRRSGCSSYLVPSLGQCSQESWLVRWEDFLPSPSAFRATPCHSVPLPNSALAACSMQTPSDQEASFVCVCVSGGGYCFSLLITDKGYKHYFKKESLFNKM